MAYPMSLEERRQLTAEERRQPHWLYGAFDAAGRLLYIGQTRNPMARLQKHRSNAKLERERAHLWVPHVVVMRWRAYPDWHRAVWAEREAIRAERPLFNRQGAA